MTLQNNTYETSRRNVHYNHSYLRLRSRYFTWSRAKDGIFELADLVVQFHRRVSIQAGVLKLRDAGGPTSKRRERTTIQRGQQSTEQNIQVMEARETESTSMRKAKTRRTSTLRPFLKQSASTALLALKQPRPTCTCFCVRDRLLQAEKRTEGSFERANPKAVAVIPARLRQGRSTQQARA